MAMISVIIPVYNSGAYLKRCLQSVLGQTHADLEVILIDDGSTDESPAIIDDYAKQDERVKVIHQANAGQSVARNAGLAIAQGDYIGFVDSDDWIELDTYAYLLGLLTAYQADISEINLEVAYASSHQMPNLEEQIEVYAGEEILIYYFEHNEFSVCLRLYQRDVLYGLLFDVGRINEDVVYGFKALRNAKQLVSSNLPKYHYFSNPLGTSESPLRLRDMDLLFAGEQLDELTQADGSDRLRKLVLTKKYRSPFTLLVKMALFGCSQELDRKQTERELRGLVKAHYGFLIKSQMPMNRKLLLTACRYAYPLVKLAGRVYVTWMRQRA
ncbi:MAG: glycosyltransferase [Coriobacteriia bacterium]|nr:glycosyltransferase [Coriobacteriia bacterium]